MPQKSLDPDVVEDLAADLARLVKQHYLSRPNDPAVFEVLNAFAIVLAYVLTGADAQAERFFLAALAAQREEAPGC